MEEKLIAPCGMNCALCVSYLARKNDLNRKGFSRVYCEGCQPRGKGCLHMADSCDRLGKGQLRFCFDCEDFPCKRLKALDKRYSTKYHMSMIENLQYIKSQGIDSFLDKERKKWSCPNCGEAVCCHDGLCLKCELETLRVNRKYRWDRDNT